MGHSYFKNGQYNKATQVFNAIVDAEPSTGRLERAQWYLLLSLLPNYSSGKDQVEKLFQTILLPENYHNYQQKAQQLKAQMN